MRRMILAGLAICLMLAGAAQPALAKRVALVVGNNAYEHVDKLRKAVNDASAMGDTLRDLGFEVLRASDVGRRDMNRRIQEFGARIEPGDVAVFFYAGHGVEIDGQNFLLPIDVPKVAAGNEEFLKSEAVAVVRLMEVVRRRGARINILVLDACRDNPFKLEGGRSVGGGRGLARMAAPEGTFIMYSAGVGQTALDRLGNADPHPNSVFTRSLIPLLRQSGLSLPQAARKVRREVQKLAGTMNHLQRPAYYDEVTGEFFFRPGKAARPEPEPPKAQDSAESLLWAEIEDTTDPADLEFYLRRFPNGGHAAIARLKLERLARKKTAVLAPATTKKPEIARKAALHDCDRLAAVTYDVHHVGAGVNYDDMDAAKALPVCERAVRAHPEEARFAFQLSLAFYKLRRFEEAAKWARKAAEKDYAPAVADYGAMHYMGEGVAKDQATALRLIRKSAEAGDPHGMTWLGLLYKDGEAVGKDYAEAEKWFRKAIDRGADFAMRELGSMYLDGLGVKKDAAEAKRWFLKAAEAGDAYAHTRIGVMYTDGLGVRKDYAEARKWLLKAAGKNESGALYTMGVLYRDGLGVRKNHREARAWFEKSFEYGDADAANEVGFLYQNGFGVAKDPKEARKWYLQGANRGSADAMWNLAYLSDDGKGVSFDAATAAHYLLKAAHGGQADARKDLTSGLEGWKAETRKAVQTELRDAGVYNGAIDGKFGSGTKRAIEAYLKLP